ncbi:MAG TPA: dienelactone hydrolase family protein [Gammaproteobacteria bacterium]|nr:dienelactone hydrolase family protein [Gammaproteobacteria bacterium]
MRRSLAVVVLTWLIAAQVAVAAVLPGTGESEFDPLVSGGLQGRMVTLKTASGATFKAYVSGSRDADRGIVLIHDWRGLTRGVKSWADRFAGQGYRAMAVDLYGGRVTDDPDRARRWIGALNAKVLDAKLKAAVRAVQAPGRPLVIMGWGFGGREALRAAVRMPDAISAVVDYYGVPLHDASELSALQGPVLGVFASRDTGVTPGQVAAFWKAMRAADQPLEIHVYAADHGFASPSSDGYDGVAAQAAWRATVAFLQRSLQ